MGKKVSKASILKDLMQSRSPRLSTDRTKRVAGLPAFANQSAASHITSESPMGAPSLRIGHPIATLVNCDGQCFLAVAQVNNIILGSRVADSILLDLISDPGAKISFVSNLAPGSPDADDEPDGKHDWKWSLGFESKSVFNVPGHLIHPLNPTVSHRIAGHPTYLFSSDILITVATAIDGQLESNQRATRGIIHNQANPDLPAGKTCFHVEIFLANGNERGEFGRDAAPLMCGKCFSAVPIKTNNYQRILEHNGAHILFDKTIMALEQPCGLCLRPFTMCTFEFLKSKGTAAARQVNWARSTCLNPLKFQMAAAMK
ncbi:hypothetical protein B0H17DRAFT_947261 [Mycena rosella]|uniref:Uncharacterized protein n=1 Tax=Mycena rosella TaxID=1033263 RepID=A0AAD7GAQ7_MYCRO|nr:hypothetical protein B0H17DRAFT_947261 [Mycena rosella]